MVVLVHDNNYLLYYRGLPVTRPSQILPSYLKRKSSGCSASKSKKRRTISYDRDIICLPPKYRKKEDIPYPRGKYRSELGRKGLVGKVHLTTDMSVVEVENEIRSVFSHAMGSECPFQYLQPAGGGSRSLTVPSVSSSFQWSAQQVAKLGNCKNTIYILAMGELNVPGSEVSTESYDAKSVMVVGYAWRGQDSIRKRSCYFARRGNQIIA